MPKKKTCAWKSEIDGWQCPRPVWIGGRSDEKYCLFHSESMDKKKGKFRAEIEEVKIGMPSDIYKMGQKKNCECCDFRGFRFPEGCSDFDVHEFKAAFIYFSEAQFGDTARFRGAQFSGDAVFKRAIFSGKADFGMASFYKDADFEGAKFEKDQYFFFNSMGELGLRSAECSGNIIIFNSDLKNIDASRMSYKGLFTLENVNFYGDSEKDKSDLNGIYLERAQFIGTNLDRVAFGGAFIKEVIFDRISFGKATDSRNLLSEPWYCGRPDEAIYEERFARHVANLPYPNGNVIEIHLSFPIDLSIDEKIIGLHRSAETVYRTLKHVMKSQNAGNLSRRMRAGELEMRYQVMELKKPKPWWKPKNLWRRFLIWAKQQPIGSYRFLNGYGLRWIRTLVLWLVCVFSFAFFGYIGKEVTFEQFDLAQQQYVVRAKKMDFWEATWHSLEMTSVIASPSLHIEDPGIRWVEGLERFLSPVLLLLFLQAARNAARD